MQSIADELIRSVEQELNYVHQAANAKALGAVPTKGVRIPPVVSGLSTRGRAGHRPGGRGLGRRRRCGRSVRRGPTLEGTLRVVDPRMDLAVAG